MIEIKIPSPGESISEVEISKWLVQDGAVVSKDQEIAEVESDKATFTLSASASGKISILLKEGARTAVGTIACTIDETVGMKPEGEEKTISKDQSYKKEAEPVAGETVQKVIEEKQRGKEQTVEKKVEKESAIEQKSGEPEIDKTQEMEVEEEKEPDQELTVKEADKKSPVDNSRMKFTAAAKAVMDAEGLSVDDVVEGIHRLTKKDIESVVRILKSGSAASSESNERTESRSPMSPLRRKLSQRLVSVKNETAMLTTFNEIDMSRLVQLRTDHQKQFFERFGVKLGYMSFFAKAASIALAQYPAVNSMIDGEDIVTPDYHDIGIAVQTEKGLMVPIIRDASKKSIAKLENEIYELAEKARNKKLSIQEMTGGTFTITNGGVFGSLMSTPILNPPQSAILGMHAIKERPVAAGKQIEIRPMMYVALTYDHRIIDGINSVKFLYKIKELIEDPASLLLNGKHPEDLLLE